MTNRYTDLPLDDLPLIPKEDSVDLPYVMAQQISILAQMILWIRCSIDGSIKDMNGRDLRKMRVTDLVGSFTTAQSYKDFVKYDCNGKDPLDLTDYISVLMNIYEQRQLLKGTGNKE
jgi:hypothetical protein